MRWGGNRALVRGHVENELLITQREQVTFGLYTLLGRVVSG